MNIRQLLKLDLTSCCGQTLVINNAGRIRWIDQLRGLAILFVFFAHGGGWHPVFEYVMMPIFFFLSGYLHKDKSNFVQFVKRIVLRIYIPYVFFCSIRAVMHILTSHDIEFYARELVESLIFGTSNIWFFPCLISVEILAFITDKLPLRGRLPQLVLTMGGGNYALRLH